MTSKESFANHVLNMRNAATPRGEAHGTLKCANGNDDPIAAFDPVEEKHAVSNRPPAMQLGPSSWDGGQDGGVLSSWFQEFEHALRVWNESFHPARG